MKKNLLAIQFSLVTVFAVGCLEAAEQDKAPRDIMALGENRFIEFAGDYAYLQNDATGMLARCRLDDDCTTVEELGKTERSIWDDELAVKGEGATVVIADRDGVIEINPTTQARVNVSSATPWAIAVYGDSLAYVFKSAAQLVVERAGSEPLKTDLPKLADEDKPLLRGKGDVLGLVWGQTDSGVMLAPTGGEVEMYPFIGRKILGFDWNATHVFARVESLGSGAVYMCERGKKCGMSNDASYVRPILVGTAEAFGLRQDGTVVTLPFTSSSSLQYYSVNGSSATEAKRVKLPGSRAPGNGAQIAEINGQVYVASYTTIQRVAE